MTIRETYRQKRYLIVLTLSFLFILLLYFDKIASNPVLSMNLDRLILYNIDESLHYCYVKAVNFYPVACINPFAKIGFTMIHGIILYFTPQHPIVLRILNSIYAIGILILLVKLASVLKMSVKAAFFAIVLTIAFPLFFLGAISILTELMFSFVLISAVYLFYKEKYFVSSVTISLLPLIHQYGFLYLFIWAFLFIKKKQIRLVFPVFVPIILWSMANKFLLGHPLVYTLYYRSFLSSSPPLDCLVSPMEFLNFYILLIAPLSLLFLIMFIYRQFIDINDDKINVIYYIIILQLLLFAVDIIIIPFIYTRSFVYKLRVIIPAVPLMAIIVSFLFEAATKKLRKHQNFIYIFFIIISFFYLPYSINKLQKFAFIKNEVLSVKQETDLMEAERWLCSYADEKNFTAIVCQGDDLPSSVSRRIWMSLPGKIRFFTVNKFDAADKNVFDVLTYKRTSIRDLRQCLFMTRYVDKKLMIGKLKLLKAFPSLSLYFYGF